MKLHILQIAALFATACTSADKSQAVPEPQTINPGFEITTIAPQHQIDSVRNIITYLCPADDYISAGADAIFDFYTPALDKITQIVDSLNNTDSLLPHGTRLAISLLPYQLRDYRVIDIIDLDKQPQTTPVYSLYLVNSTPQITAADVLSCEKTTTNVVNGPEFPVIMVTLNDTGAKKFAQLTADNIGRALPILLNGKVISAPRVMTPIEGGKMQITSDDIDQLYNAIVQ